MSDIRIHELTAEGTFNDTDRYIIDKFISGTTYETKYITAQTIKNAIKTFTEDNINYTTKVQTVTNKTYTENLLTIPNNTNGVFPLNLTTQGGKQLIYLKLYINAASISGGNGNRQYKIYELLVQKQANGSYILQEIDLIYNKSSNAQSVLNTLANNSGGGNTFYATFGSAGPAAGVLTFTIQNTTSFVQDINFKIEIY